MWWRVTLPAADMPLAEVEVDEALVRSLLETQQPDLAALPLSMLAFGWDNVVWRLGEELTVRLPRRQVAAELIEHEQRWLALLAPRLPIPVPVPLRTGQPSSDYPWPWSVCSWLPGEPAASHPPRASEAAEQLGAFVRAMRSNAPDDAPRNSYRAVPLVERAPFLEERVGRLGDVIGSTPLLSMWSESLQVPAWSGHPQWQHGDLHPANILVAGGAVSAVIDFGDLTAGDPAADVSVAWMMFDSPDTRAVFRQSAGAQDEDLWERARGNAIAFTVAVLATSANNALLRGVGERTLANLLDDR